MENKNTFQFKTVAITGLAIFLGSMGIMALVTFASEPLPDHVQEKANNLPSRVEAITAIDAKMKPKKEELAELQSIRDLLEQDLQADVQSLDRWGYDVDWNSLTVSPKAKPSTQQKQ